MQKFKLIVGGLICVGCLLTPVVSMASYKINTQPIHFDKGTSGTAIHNAVSGADVKDYTLVAKAGQTMRVSMKRGGHHPYFNVINPVNETVFNGAMRDGDFEQRLATSGKYTVRVYQMGGARDEGKTSPYELTFKIIH